MGKRGPKSTKNAIAAPEKPQILPILDPPARLTESQAKYWREIVARMGPDWFPEETHGLLVQLVRHMDRADAVAGMLDLAIDAKDVTKLMQMEEVQTRAIAACATKLMLTPRSTKRQETTSRPPVLSELDSDLWQPAS